MNRFMGEGTGRFLIVNLSRGDLLLEEIKRALKESDIRYGVLTSAIGSLQKVVLHRVVGTGAEPEDEFITLEKPMELASLQGVIVGGEPHFHMVVSDTENTYTGHLEPGTKVLYLAEVSILEWRENDLTREKDENNIAVLREKQEG